MTTDTSRKLRMAIAFALSAALPLQMLAAVSVTASRDYVDKKVASVAAMSTNYTDRAVSLATNGIEKAIAGVRAEMSGKISDLRHTLTNEYMSAEEVAANYIRKDEVAAIVVDIVTNLYGNICWNSEDGGQTMEAFYFGEDIITNAVRKVNMHLESEIQSTGFNAVPIIRYNFQEAQEEEVR